MVPAVGSTSCPVCETNLLSGDALARHLSTHTKEEVVAALLSRSKGQKGLLGEHSSVFGLSSNNSLFSSQQSQVKISTSGTSSSSNQLIAFSNKEATVGNRDGRDPVPIPSQVSSLQPQTSAPLPVNSSTSSPSLPPILMPHMMGMVQVMSSPCLIPQQNGPPLLINMPSYVYPNMMLNGMSTFLPGNNILGTSSNTFEAMNLTQSACIAPRNEAQHVQSSAVLTATSSSAQSHSGPSQPTPCGPEPDSVSVCDPKITKAQKPRKVESHHDADSQSQRQEHGFYEKERGIPNAFSPVPGVSGLQKASFDSIPVKNIISDSLVPIQTDNLPKPSTSTEQDTLLSENSHQVGSEGGQIESSSNQNSSPRKCSLPEREPPGQENQSDNDKVSHSAGPQVFGFTQYAEDSPYPAASLSFPPVLLEDHHSLVPKQFKNTNAEPNTTSKGTSQLKTQKDCANNGESSKSSSNGTNLCTVQTLDDLKNALKSMDDVQIVVPNELLETHEFKTFISSLNSFPLHESPASPAGTHNGSDAIKVPPNTPIPTRPSSTVPNAENENEQRLEKGQNSGPLSPQPCSSRELTQECIVPNTNDSDDDISLQDLVAMETMDDEDVCDDDHFFTLNSSTNPLEPFMNAMLQGNANETSSTSRTGMVFTCDKCGLQFLSLSEFNNHKGLCTHKGGVGKKSAKSCKVKNSKFARSNRLKMEENSLPMLENMELMEKDAIVIKSEVKSEIKSEIMDSSSQPALGATGQNWKCNQCKAIFESGFLLIEHLENLRNSEHKCTDCHMIFDDRKTKLLHRKRIHSVAASKIKQEQSAFATPTPPSEQGDFAGIKVQPNENGDYMCDICDRAFREYDLLVKHMSCHDENRPYECLECGKKFSKASSLRDHRKRHFEIGCFECSYCKKRFFTPNKLREHVRVHTGEAPLACKICGKTFKRHSNLSEHKRTHLEDRAKEKSAKELFCHCGKVFKTQRDLDWHKEGEHEKKPKKCNFCGEVFVHSSSLTKHIRQKHESGFLPENKKSSLYANCPVCNLTFYKTSINKHIRIKHEGQKPYSCDICKASFVTKYNLTNHQWQHKGIRARPFKCQQCNKAYFRKSLLENHMRSHRGVKPFVCNECGLQFANKSNWQRHVAEHEGPRNFQCIYCNKKFSRGYYLTDHMRTHTGEKPYVCGLCGKTAATRSNYNSHMRTHITREPVNSEV